FPTRRSSDLGCRTSALPTSPSPVTMLSTPGGSTSLAISPSSVADKGHCSEGLRTTEFPAISGEATPWVAIAIGWLKATILPTTPYGSRIVMLNLSELPGIVVPCNSIPGSSDKFNITIRAAGNRVAGHDDSRQLGQVQHHNT